MLADAGTVKLGWMKPGAVGIAITVKTGPMTETNISVAVSWLLSWLAIIVPLTYSGILASVSTLAGSFASRNCSHTPRNSKKKLSKVSETLTAAPFCVVPA